MTEDGSLAYGKYSLRGGNIHMGGGDEKYGIATIETRKENGVNSSGDGVCLDTGQLQKFLPFNDGSFIFFIGGTEGGDFTMKQVLDRVLVVDKLVFAYIASGYPELTNVEEFQDWLDSDSADGNTVDSAGFFYDSNEPDDFPNNTWHIFTHNSVGQTVVDTGVLVTNQARSRLEMSFKLSNTTFTFKINGANVGTINTTIPSGTQKLAMGTSVHTLDDIRRTLRIDSWGLQVTRVT